MTMTNDHDSGRPNVELSGLPLYECATCPKSVDADETYCETCRDSGVAEQDLSVHTGY